MDSKVRKYLDKKGFSYTIKNSNGKTNYNLNCPICGETEHKFYIEESTGKFHCFHENTCGKSGNLWSLQKLLGDTPDKPEKYNINGPVKKTYTKPNPIKYGMGKEVFEWLIKRGISERTINRFNLKQKGKDTLVIPYYKNGELVFVKYRNIYTKKMYTSANSEPVLYNRDSVKGKELVICEGELDAIAYAQYGVTAVSVHDGANNMSWLENEWKWLEQFETIFISMDNDKAGQTAVLKIVDRLGYERCKNVILPYKDINECLVSGVTKEDLQQFFIDAEEFQRELIKKPKDIRKRLEERLFNKTKRIGIPTPFDLLTYFMGGFREGELTVIGGVNHSGKSTLFIQTMLYLIRMGHSCFMASLEQKLEEWFSWAVIQESYNGEPTHESMEELLEKTGDRLVMLDTVQLVTPEVLFDNWEYSAKRYGTKYFFLDSLMKIDLEGRDEYRAQTKFVSQVALFAQKYSCHVFMIAHMRKGEKDTYVPGKVDIAGSANITNLAHNVLTVWRVPEVKEGEEKVCDTKLFIKKCRETGRIGYVKLEFNPETRTFTEIRKY